MKKILVYFGNLCGENSKGGTEVATYRIAKALKDSGLCEVYHAYHSNYGMNPDPVYADSIVLPKSKKGIVDTLPEFIRLHEIDNVIVMGRFFKFGKLKAAADKSGRNPSIFFMQHFAPGSEKKKTTYSSSWHLLLLNPKRIRYYLRAFFYPVLKLPRTLRWGKVYREAYNGSKNVILLSKGYFRDYCKVASLKNDDKFVAIPNIYTPDNNIDPSELKKEKRVLILSRMDEIQKRISLALKIWKNIEQDPRYEDWHLDIVGSGNNNDIVKRLLKKGKFKNVTFHGWQPREEFLKRSPILMMTSEYEGLPLSLLEAQAYGCVPIAFNSFASLKDIIDDEKNGIIVDKFGDVENYTKKLKHLMEDHTYREKLSAGSALNIDKFSPEKIAQQWLKILT